MAGLRIRRNGRNYFPIMFIEYIRMDSAYLGIVGYGHDDFSCVWHGILTLLLVEGERDIHTVTRVRYDRTVIRGNDDEHGH